MSWKAMFSRPFIAAERYARSAASVTRPIWILMQAPAVDIGVHPPLRSLKGDGLTLPDKLTQRFALNQNPRPAFHFGAASGVAANSSHPANHCTAHAPGGRLAFDGPL